MLASTTYKKALFLLLLFALSAVDSSRFNLGKKKETPLPSTDSSFSFSSFRQQAGEHGATITMSMLAIVLGGLFLMLNKNTKKNGSNEVQNGASPPLPTTTTSASVDIAFSDISLTLHKKGKITKTILNGSIRGRAQPGRLLGILGPSGSGKTSTLHALAGRIQYQSNAHLSGTVQSTNAVAATAFVEQQALFFPYMTVRETVAFRVELKWGSYVKVASQKEAMVNEVLAQMGLSNVADTIVGDVKVRGISGGERKRLSIAVELVSNPAVLYLDEPTSGLDSTAATKLVKSLRALADAGKTVIAVIHQPSQHVFTLFDDILLVSEGRQMYFGPREQVRSYMAMHGCKAPTEMGTAEHILDCISRAPIGDETDEQMKERLEKLAQAAEAAPIELGTPKSNKVSSSPRQSAAPLRRANLLVQFRLLLKRSFREIIRGKTTIILKCVQQVTTAIIYGGIYTLGKNQASIQDRFGLLSLVAIGSMNQGLVQTVRSFPREKSIVSNELSSKMYRTLPYFIGKALSEIPLVAFYNSLFGLGVYYLTGLDRTEGKVGNFLGLLSLHGLVSQAVGLFIGSISKNSDIAIAMMPAAIILSIIFDGKNISEENIPRFLRWIQNVGLVRWGFEGLCLNEFSGQEFETGGSRRGLNAKTGEEALDLFGLGSNQLPAICQAQVLIISGCWLLSYLGLTLSRQKYLVMKPKSGKA